MQRLKTKIEYVHYFMLVVRKRQKLIWVVSTSTLVSILFFGWLVTPVWEGTSLVLVERASKQTLGLFKDVDMPVSEASSSGSAALDLIPTLLGWNMAYDLVKQFHLDDRDRERHLNPPTARDWIKKAMAEVVYSPLTLLEWLGLRPSAEKDWLDDAADDFLDDWLDVEEEEEGTGVINITVYGETPKLATDISNAMVQWLRDKTRSFTRDGAENSRSFVESQLQVASETLRKAEDDLAKYKAENSLFSIDDERTLKVQKIDQFQTALLNTQKERREAEANLAAVARELGSQPERKVLSATIAKNPTVAEFENNLVDLELKKASLLVEKAEGHPDVQAIQAQIDSARAEIQASVKEAIQAQTEAINPTYQDLLSRSVDLKVQRDVLVARESAFGKIISDLEADLRGLPAKEVELARLSKIVEIDRSIFETLKNRLERLQIEKKTENNEYNLRVLDSAFVPPSRDQDWPLWWLNILVGLFLGGVFGFGTAFVAEYWNEPVLTVADVEEGLGVPFLGRISDLQQPPPA